MRRRETYRGSRDGSATERERWGFDIGAPHADRYIDAQWLKKSRGRSKYKPHQGKQEIARRAARMK